MPARKNMPPAVRPGYWFVPHAYGLGATPANAFGWVATMLYLLAVGLGVSAMRTDGARLIVVAALSAGYLFLVAVKTDGGLRWRWGGR